MKAQFKKNYCPNLFSWKELEYLINIRPLMTDKRVFILNEDAYKWDNSVWALDKNCYPPSLLKGLMDTNMCYLTDMSRCTEKINSFAKSLEDEYNYQTDAHIYMCRHSSGVGIDEHPFGVHYDRSDNVIVQCEGTTNFKVWDIVDPNFNDYKMTPEEVPEEPILDVDMEPGDTIWIPVYAPHLAVSKTKRMSVSFPINRKERVEDREWVRL